MSRIPVPPRDNHISVNDPLPDGGGELRTNDDDVEDVRTNLAVPNEAVGAAIKLTQLGGNGSNRGRAACGGRGRRGRRGFGSNVPGTAVTETCANMREMERFQRAVEPWKVQRTRMTTIKLEEDVFNTVVNNRVKRYVDCVLEQLEESFRNAKYKHSRSSHVILLMKELMDKLIHWFNEGVRLMGIENAMLRESEMVQFIAVILYSHSTGFSLENSVTMLRRHGRRIPTLDRIRFILTHLRAFHPSHGNDVGWSSWSCQRDRTRFLIDMERAAFQTSRRHFYFPSMETLTIDDDLYGSRAQDKHVPNFNDQKAANEGFAADVVCNATFRFCHAVRFSRRGERKVDGIDALLVDLNESQGEMARRACVITVDRGYGRADFIDKLREQGYSYICVVPDYPMYQHPFLGASYLTCSHEDLIARAEHETENTATGNGSSETEGGLLFLDNEEQNEFVIEDTKLYDMACYSAVLKGDIQQQRTCRKAIAVREHTRSTVNKIVRFLVDIPLDVMSQINCWVASRKSVDQSCNIMHESTIDDGSAANVLRGELKRLLCDRCRPLTTGQRCADWFILRRFRITSTVGSMILERDAEVRAAMRKQGQLDNWNEAMWFDKLYQSWFPATKCLESMRRGSINESSIISSLKSLEFVRNIYDVGLVERRDEPSHACSPDGLALISQSFLQETGWHNSFMCAKDGMSYAAATVDIKTVVTGSAVSANVTSVTTKPMVKHIFDEEVLRRVDHSHLLQVAQQCYVLQTNLGLYALCTETEVIFVALLYVDSAVLNTVGNALRRISDTCVKWAHAERQAVPFFCKLEMHRVFNSYLPFWTLLNNHVSASPLPPIRHFRHGLQLYYSKTKGVVDGLTQYRSIVASQSTHLQWEQTVVLQVIKAVVVNSLISYRLLEASKRGTQFSEVDSFRHSLNAMESFPDYISYLVDELLDHADTVYEGEQPVSDDESVHQRDGRNVVSSNASMSSSTLNRLTDLAQSKKRSRLTFFNSSDGKRLRLSSGTHVPQRLRSSRWCALCGASSKKNLGRKTTSRCATCTAPLCLRLHSGAEKSCFHEWHTSSILFTRGRNPTQMSQRSSSSNSPGNSGVDQPSTPSNPPAPPSPNADDKAAVASTTGDNACTL